MSTSDISRPADEGLFHVYEASLGKKPDHDEHNGLSLAPLLPKVRRLLTNLNNAGADCAAFSVACPSPSIGEPSSTPLLDILGNNLLTLQESFIDRLCETLRQWGVDPAIKLILRLDDEAELRVEGEHPDSERIRAMLTAFPEYSSMFAEIAVQSAVLRELKNLWAISGCDRVQDSYAALVGATVNSHYRISLKGEMNHFYFAKALLV